MLQRAELLKGKHVLVLGLGISGQSAARFLLNRQALVVGVDRDSNSVARHPNISELCLKGMKLLPEQRCLDLDAFDLLVVSPGISSDHPIYKKAKELDKEIIGEIELACREITHKCLGITGTNGKTTVTLLTTHVLQKSGIKARALGNVGVPLTQAVDDALHNDVDVFVIELSSFQLETLTQVFLEAAVILNISPDHLDRYASIDEYAKAKIGVIKNLKKDGRLFVGEKCLKDFHYLFETDNIYPYGYESTNYFNTDKQNAYYKSEKIFSVPLQYQDKRTHEMENLMASYALCSTLAVTPEEFLNGFATFQKPSHRIEFVKTIHGVNYYDDSKGTNIDAVIRAVEELNGPIILIAGGVDKGFSYSPWIHAFANKVKAICAIGQSKEIIKKDLADSIPVILFSNLDEAVSYASSLAKAGENVLLSPGCSSFDMFKDYVHRGQEFQRMIHAL